MTRSWLCDTPAGWVWDGTILEQERIVSIAMGSNIHDRLDWRLRDKATLTNAQIAAIKAWQEDFKSRLEWLTSSNYFLVNNTFISLLLFTDVLAENSAGPRRSNYQSLPNFSRQEVRFYPRTSNLQHQRNRVRRTHRDPARVRHQSRSRSIEPPDAITDRASSTETWIPPNILRQLRFHATRAFRSGRTRCYPRCW